MSTEKQKLSIEAARLYYLMDYTQQEIANILDISRPTVSRLLAYSKEQGFVAITINDPFSDIEGLERALIEKYQLKEVHVVYAPTNEEKVVYKFVTEFAAEYLSDVINDGDIVGVSWGNTIYQTAKLLSKTNRSGVKVVQLKGGISYSEFTTYSTEILNFFSEAFHSEMFELPLPVIFDNVQVKNMVEQDRHIRKIIDMGKQANVAVFTVGTVSYKSLVFNLGYLNEAEKEELNTRAVGDICCRFFDKNGQICLSDLNNRTIGIELDELKKKEKSILISGGERKANSVAGALAGKYANILITDQYTAQKLLEL